MRETLKKVMDQTSLLMRKMTVSQRLSIAMLGLVIVVSLVTCAIWTGGTESDQLVLFRDLADDKADYVKDRLDEWGFAYEEEEGVIRVAREDKYRITGKFIGDPVFSREGNFDFLFNPDITGTQKQKEMQYREAIRRTVRSALKTWPGVKDAEVIISPAESSRFVSAKLRQATASVNLTMEFGQKLAPEQVRGISMFMSGAVDKLLPENVQIIAGGKHYNMKQSEKDASPLGTRHALQEAVAETIEEKIRSMIGATYSDSRIIVQVALDMKHNLLREETTGKSERIKSTEIGSASEGSKGTGGSPGVRNNVEAGSQPSSISGGRKEVTKSSETKIEELYEPGGKELKKGRWREITDTIKSLHVSIAIPWREAVMTLDGKVPESPEEKDRVLADNIKSVLTLARGAVDKKFEDLIVVSAARFRQPEILEDTTSTLTSVALIAKEHGGTLLLGLFALVSLLMITSLVKKSIPAPVVQTVVEAEPAEEASAQEPDDQEILQSLSDGDSDHYKADIYKGRIHQSVQEDAASSADLLKRWLVKEA